MKTIQKVLLLLFVFGAAAVQGQNLRVVSIDFATDIVDRKAVGVDTTFTADVGTVYCHSVIKGASDTTKVTHYWHYKSEEKARVPLTVASENWRTWSSKSIPESWTGSWRVIIEDQNGHVLASKMFTIRD